MPVSTQQFDDLTRRYTRYGVGPTVRYAENAHQISWVISSGKLLLISGGIVILTSRTQFRFIEQICWHFSTKLYHVGTHDCRPKFEKLFYYCR